MSPSSLFSVRLLDGRVEVQAEEWGKARKGTDKESLHRGDADGRGCGVLLLRVPRRQI